MIPTSNHNLLRKTLPTFLLYIFWSLHQTTTANREDLRLTRCISFDPYIKPQRTLVKTFRQWSCISFDPYIKPQLCVQHCSSGKCCISFDPYIKPQRGGGVCVGSGVVYLLIPTSNHNIKYIEDNYHMLYIFWSLHQTTTMSAHANKRSQLYIFWSLHQTTTFVNCGAKVRKLYIFWSLHQTTTRKHAFVLDECCISFDPYIKPQPQMRIWRSFAVVYLLIPTSNHNLASGLPSARLVVYLLIPTSNHNLFFPRCEIWWLYIFWSLHQTTTVAGIRFSIVGCISFDPYIKPQRYPIALESASGCISFDPYIKPQLCIR